MKNEAVARIRKTLTPEVIILEAHDTAEGIAARVRHRYCYPEREIQDPRQPICWARDFEVEADKEGNVFSTKGLFS